LAAFGGQSLFDQTLDEVRCRRHVDTARRKVKVEAVGVGVQFTEIPYFMGYFGGRWGWWRLAVDPQSRSEGRSSNPSVRASFFRSPAPLTATIGSHGYRKLCFRRFFAF
jgi:hypothetical protein